MILIHLYYKRQLVRHIEMLRFKSSKELLYGNMRVLYFIVEKGDAAAQKLIGYNPVIKCLIMISAHIRVQ